jgi:hypothetical protein
VKRQPVQSGGETTDTLDWDGIGKLRRLLCTGAQPGDYTASYDGAGTRVSATLNGASHTYSYSGGTLLHDSGNGGTVYTPGGQNRAGVFRYFHEDWLGSTRYLTDAYRFDAFGQRRAGAGGTIRARSSPERMGTRARERWGEIPA